MDLGCINTLRQLTIPWCETRIDKLNGAANKRIELALNFLFAIKTTIAVKIGAAAT